MARFRDPVSVSTKRLRTPKIIFSKSHYDRESENACRRNKLLNFGYRKGIALPTRFFAVRDNYVFRNQEKRNVSEGGLLDAFVSF